MPKAGDLLLVRGKDFIARAIEDTTRSPYSHVALFVEKDLLIEAQGFRRVGYQDPGKYAGISDVFTPLGISMGERQLICRSAARHLGEVYDYALLLVELVRYTTGLILPWTEYRSKICSTLVASAYRATGIEPFPQNKITYPVPGDYATSPLFRWEGAF